eukprot:378565-Prorocentrum_minimum.AAC.1
MLRATVRMLRATVRMLRATVRMLRATMRMLRATVRMLRALTNNVRALSPFQSSWAARAPCATPSLGYTATIVDSSPPPLVSDTDC